MIFKNSPNRLVPRWGVCLILLGVLAATTVRAQTPGEWGGATSQGGQVYFVVSGGTVQNFAMMICLSGGAGGFGCFEQVLGFGMPISGSGFSYTGVSFELSGTFTGSSACSGTWSYHDGYMGYGGGTWTAAPGVPPILELAPVNQVFPDQAIHTAGSPKTFSLRNRGGGLAAGSVALGGANADQFEITAGGGSFALSHDQSRQISVRFTPTAVGQKAAVLTAAADPPATDVFASLSGTATHPVLVVAPDPLEVPAAGGTRTLSISNGGTGTLAWTAAVGPSSSWLSVVGKTSGSGSAIITVACEPNYGVSPREGSIAVTAAGAAGSPRIVQVHQSEGLPDLVFSPASLDFGPAMAFTSGEDVVFTLTNRGGGMAAGSLSLTGLNDNEFTITGGAGAFSLAHDASVTVSVRFSPVSAGPKTALLTAERTPAGEALNAPLTGLGARPEWKLSAADGQTGDTFGAAVAIDGETAVVGATGGNAAYIFQKSQGGWIQRAKLTPSDGSTGHFGWSVDIAGDVAVVGALWNNELGTSAGMAFVFEKPPGGWADMTETTRLTGHDTAAGDNFGGAVAVSGATVLVGAYGDDDNGSLSGSAYLFQRQPGGWAQVAKLTASDGTFSDYFGRAADICGDSAIIGADGHRSAYVFEKPAAGWADMTETAVLTTCASVSTDYFGAAVSISGGAALVGARGDYSGSYRGAAYVFEKPPEGWVDMCQTAKLTANIRDQLDSFGQSVALLGNSAVVGIPGDDNLGYGSNTGSAGLFRKPGAGWAGMSETVKLTASDAQNGDCFGYAVALSEDHAAVSAYWDDDLGSNAGAVYILYSRNFPPVISPIQNRPITTAASTGPLSFTVYDSETPAAALALSVSSSNRVLVPEENIAVEGTGWYRTLSLSPAPGHTGSAEITVAVSDGQDTVETRFSVTVPDGDGDGLPDYLENSGCTESGNSDSDGDDIPDGLEDADRDGEVDAGETDPCVWDTDGDGLSDGLEDANRNGIVDSGESDPLDWDTDGDGLGDGQEDVNRNGIRDPGETDPGNWDSDGDDCGDQDERAAGSNPLSPDSVPCIVCVDPDGDCSQCEGDFQCFASIREGIDHAASRFSPHALVKVFTGSYTENVIVPARLRVTIMKGPVILPAP